MTRVANLKSDDSTISQLDYQYDPAGNKIRIATAAGSLTTYAYDKTYQLTEEWKTAAGRLDEAEQTYLRILQEQTPRHFASMDLGIADYKARHNLAIVYEDWGKPDIARQVWEDILQTRPDYQPARQALQRTE